MSVPMNFKLGDRIRQTFTFTTPSGPINLTNYTFIAKVRDKPESTTVLATFNVSVTAASGLVVIDIPGTVSSTLPTDRLLSWDLRWTAPGATGPDTVVSGTLSMSSGVSW